MTGEVIRSSKVDGPPLRAGTSRRARPRRREEARADPRGRGLAGPWARDGQDRAEAPGSASTTSIRWSTTTAGSPTRRSSLTRRVPPAPNSWHGQLPGSSIKASIGSSEVMTDNAQELTQNSGGGRTPSKALGARHVFIRPHCPWQNGKVERFNRTLQIEWAYRQAFSVQQRIGLDALAPWLRALQHRASPQRTRGSAADQSACHRRNGRVHLEIAFYEFMAVGLGLFILGLFLHWDFGNVGS